MILPLLLAAAAAAPAASTTASPPELWRGARAGMTLEQVQMLFPKGRGGTGAVDSGAAAGWANDEPVYGRPGVATFYFKDGRLAEVLVELKGVEKGAAVQGNFQAARNLKTSLSSYYGPPKRCVERDRRGLDRIDCEWTSKGVIVGLSYQDFGGASPTMDVALRPVPPRRYNPGITFGRHGRRG